MKVIMSFNKPLYAYIDNYTKVPFMRSVLNDVKRVIYDKKFTTIEYNDGKIDDYETKNITHLIIGE